jgi:serine/threonine-protein kinase HipA
MTKRFDRHGNTKHHMQSLCAMSHLDYKQRGTHSYEQLFMTLRALGLGTEAVDQTFARMAFNVIARNCDDHTKNFSFLLRQGGQWELSPAYDVTHAHNPQGEWTAQHLLSVNGKFDEILDEDMLVVAQRFSVRSPAEIIERVKVAVKRWPEFSEAASISSQESERVGRDFTLLH